MAQEYVQMEVSYYLKKMLSPNGLSTENFIDIMKTFKKSRVQHNKEVFSCIISDLVVKWRFFLGHSCKCRAKYANAFGSIIEHDLISNPNTLKDALQLVLVALKSTPGTHMYDFGITALNRFHKRYGNCEYVDRIYPIPHLKKFPRHLIEWVENNCKRNASARVLKGGYEKPANSEPQATVRCSPEIKSAAAVMRSVELKEYDFGGIDRCPTDEEKMTFIINNLSENNLREKCAEIKKILTGENVRWLSEYLVEKRVCVEFNLHALYSNLLDGIANENLDCLVMSITVEKICALLDGNTMNNKHSLNTLGHWLGVITLAKNKPLPFNSNYLNSLLIGACIKAEGLVYIIPFIAKILVCCSKSKDFGPKSSWTLRILESLVELHSLPGLKLFLQFDIEVLFKSLNFGLEDFKSGQYRQ